MIFQYWRFLNYKGGSIIIGKSYPPFLNICFVFVAVVVVRNLRHDNRILILEFTIHFCTFLLKINEDLTRSGFYVYTVILMTLNHFQINRHVLEHYVLGNTWPLTIEPIIPSGTNIPPARGIDLKQETNT